MPAGQDIRGSRLGWFEQILARLSKAAPYTVDDVGDVIEFLGFSRHRPGCPTWKDIDRWALGAQQHLVRPPLFSFGTFSSPPPASSSSSSASAPPALVPAMLPQQQLEHQEAVEDHAALEGDDLGAPNHNYDLCSRAELVSMLNMFRNKVQQVGARDTMRKIALKYWKNKAKRLESHLKTSRGEFNDLKSSSTFVKPRRPGDDIYKQGPPPPYPTTFS